MKKRVLCLLLATLMCVSVFFISCEENDDGDQEKSVIKSSQTVFDEMASVNLMQGKRLAAEYLKTEGLSILFTSFEGGTSTEEMGAILGELELGGDFTVTMPSDQQTEPLNLSIDLKDGLIYGASNWGGEMYALLRGTEVLEFDKDDNGEWYLAGSEIIGAPSDSDMGKMTELLAMLEGFSFGDITPYDIVYTAEKGIFVLNNVFLAEKLTVKMLASEGLTVKDVDGETLAKMIAEYKNMLDSMNFVIGFGMLGSELSAVIFSIDVDADTMQELEIVEPGVDAHAKMSLVYRVTNYSSTIKGMSLNIDMYQEDELDIDLRFDVDLIYIVGQLTGMNLSIDMAMNGMAVDYEYIEDCDVLGDMCFSTELFLDFDAARDEDVMVFDLFYELDNIRTKNGASVNAEKYEQSVSLSCKMTVKSSSKLNLTGVAELSVPAVDLASDAVFFGAVFLDSAPNFPAEIPPIIQEYMK
ncbi:MAG: hypothetical protein IJD64_02465 [Clostridia bacterium]|nr:hypothetical protein [Clostridia bacterium]